MAVMLVLAAAVATTAAASMPPKVYRPGARASAGDVGVTLLQVSIGPEARPVVTVRCSIVNISPAPVPVAGLPRLSLLRLGGAGPVLEPEENAASGPEPDVLKPGEGIERRVVFAVPGETFEPSAWVLQIGPGSALIALR